MSIINFLITNFLFDYNMYPLAIGILLYYYYLVHDKINLFCHYVLVLRFKLLPIDSMFLSTYHNLRYYQISTTYIMTYL